MNARNATAGGSMPEETRAFARLPGFDIAIHHTAARDGEGERMTVVVQHAAGGPALVPSSAAFDPMRMWLTMAQAAWLPWLALTGSFWAVPRIIDRK